MTFTVKYQSSVLPTDQWLNATLVGIDGTDGSLSYNNNLCLRLVFQLSGSGYEGRNVSVLTGHKFSPSSKLGRLVKGMLGREPGEGEEVELSSFINQDFQVMVEPKAGNGRTFYNVAEVRAADGDSE